MNVLVRIAPHPASLAYRLVASIIDVIPVPPEY